MPVFLKPFYGGSTLLELVAAIRQRVCDVDCALLRHFPGDRDARRARAARTDQEDSPCAIVIIGLIRIVLPRAVSAGDLQRVGESFDAGLFGLRLEGGEGGQR